MADPARAPGVLSLHVLPAAAHDKDWDAIIVRRSQGAAAGRRC